MIDAEKLTTAAVLGAGTMGAGIAQACAQAGLATRLHDVTEELAAAGRGRVEAMLGKGVEKGKVSPEERDATLGLLTTTTDVALAVRGAEIVIEAAPERLELKRGIFARVAELVSPACVLATNTSSLSITSIADGLPAPGRIVGMHFFNPVPLMRLLEVVRGDMTDDSVVALAVGLGRRLGKEPIVVRDRPGFASSRLGLALGLEAIRMVEEGVASAADIDKAMELGYRHPMGPLKLTDLVGLDVRLAIAEYLAEKLDSRRFAPPDLLRRMVAEGHVGQKSGRGFYRWVDGNPEEP